MYGKKYENLQNSTIYIYGIYLCDIYDKKTLKSHKNI